MTCDDVLGRVARIDTVQALQDLVDARLISAEAAWRHLVQATPALGEYEKAMSVAVNAEYARMSAPLRDGDEVAFLPPVSGG